MVFVAVRPDGRSMDTALPVDDPTGDKISLAPGASLTGEINLEWVIRDLRRATRESDVRTKPLKNCAWLIGREALLLYQERNWNTG